MKKLLIVALLPLAAFAVEVDGIVARVGSEAVLRSDVCNEMRRMGLQDDSRFTEIRNEMIDRKLILKAASGSGMTMQEWVIENRVREIINKAFDGDRNKLIEMLKQQRVSYPEWHQRLKEDLIVGAMRWNVVDKNVTASPRELRQEYEAHPERYRQDARMTVSVILLSPEQQSRRDEISAALASKSFEELGGKVYADIKPDDVFKPEIVKELSEMPKGTISRWIELDGWSFLLRKDKESVGKQMSFEDAYDQVEAAVKEANARKLYEAWIERLRSETYIKVY